VQDLFERNPQSLSERLRVQYETIRQLHVQQQQMYQTRTHSVEDRIVSIHQPWVRPIVRGKTTAAVEFGAKIAVALYAGYARVETLSWNAFNEGGTLQASAERYKDATGHYPARILADRIFRTRDNLNFCKKHGIHLNGPRLGRPPKDLALYRAQCRQEKAQAGERNAIECTFGVGKRRYSLGRITTKLQHTSEVAIHLVFLSMNLQKRLRSLLRSFFSDWFHWLFRQGCLVNHSPA
jgi:hypothetical protein